MTAKGEAVDGGSFVGETVFEAENILQNKHLVLFTLSFVSCRPTFNYFKILLLIIFTGGIKF